jgi:hypothetical protein
LGAFENRVLRRIFRPKREQVEGCWRRLRNEELHNLYASPNVRAIISRVGWVGHVARDINEKCIKILVGKREGKGPGRTWEDIEMELREIEFDSRRGMGIFLFITASRTALEPTQWVSGALSLEVKRPGREADPSPPSSAEIKE